jgi:hypothetical protein
MKWAWLALTLVLSPAAYSQVTNPFTLYVHDTTGKLPDTPLPAIFQLASTPVGGSSATVIKMINTSSNNVNFATAVLSVSATSVAANANFSLTGLFENQTLAPGASVLFVINFTPTTSGPLTGYLNLAFQVQQNGCAFSGSSGTICPANILNVSTLSGTATAPLLTLSYQTTAGPVVLTPSSSSPLNFPNTSLSSTSSIVFTLTNATSVATTAPAISLPVLNTNEPSAFELDISGVPATIAGGQSANFTVTFAPSQTGLASAALQVGSNTYPIQGAGIIVATIDALQISYTNATGIRTLPQAATPIPFGQVLPGSGASAVLTFSVLNPITSANSVTLPTITVSGAGFSLSGLPALPIALQPGQSTTFLAAFTPVSAGSFTGTLSIASLTFSLSGLSVSSAIPSLSLTTSGTMSSQQQINLTIQLSAPSPVAALGTITMQFTPSVANVTDDAAIVFLATAGRQLNISLAAGAQTATYNGQSTIAFQTGTTAGAIGFSVAFPDTTTYTQSFTIPPALAQLTSVQALAESPNLLVTISGYDNTYSAGQLSFTFYDTTGKIIGSPMSYNATASFQQLFFTNNPDGGLFSLQASFPVTGSITQVGSVTVGVTNSVGQSTGSASFQ